MVKVTILNQTGHTILDLSVEETIETINNHPTHWAYINGELMTVEQIMALPEDDIEDVVLTQAIVGGV